MNRTIAILTINDNTNYGNRLQNYALSQVLGRYGTVTTALVSDKAHDHAIMLARQLARDVLMVPKAGMAVAKARASRQRRFHAFTDRYVPDGRIRIGEDGTVHAKETPDAVVIGSDQVWNYSWYSPERLKVMMGASFPADRLLSYAASFGVSTLTDQVLPLFREYLARIPSISVREQAAVGMVQEATGREAALVLDPTLLVGTKAWEELAAKSAIVPTKPYVLTYFLGHPSDEQEAYIQQYAREHGAEVRRINDTRDTDTYSAGPIEFVRLFRDASYVFTDSFHACCFSVIFGKDFQVFDRSGFSSKTKSMNSRMETLYSELGLVNRMNQLDTYPTYDRDAVGAQLASWQAKSMQWLTDAMQR